MSGKIRATGISRVDCGARALIVIRTVRYGDLSFLIPRNAVGVSAQWRRAIECAAAAVRH